MNWRVEKVLGLKLFERARGRLQPTVQGLRLFEEVQRSWYGLDRIVSAAESLREFRQGELSVACLPVFSQSFLPLLLQPFLARYPDVSLQIVPQESPLLEEWLSAQRHDLGLTETLHTPAGTERTPLLTLNEVCVLPQNHPLAAKTELTPADFHGENYISLSRTDSYRQLLDVLFMEHQVKRRMVVETHSAASICALVRAGAGISVVNPLTALDYAESGVVVRRFSVRCALYRQPNPPTTSAPVPRWSTPLSSICKPACRVSNSRWRRYLREHKFHRVGGMDRRGIKYRQRTTRFRYQQADFGAAEDNAFRPCAASASMTCR